MRTACIARVVSVGLVSAFAGMALGADNDGLTLPAGFAAVVVQEGQGTARHLDVAANGDIYLAGRNGLSALRDTNGDGKADSSRFRRRQSNEWVFKTGVRSDDVGVTVSVRRRASPTGQGDVVSDFRRSPAFGQTLRSIKGHTV